MKRFGHAPPPQTALGSFKCMTHKTGDVTIYLLPLITGSWRPRQQQLLSLFEIPPSIWLSSPCSVWSETRACLQPAARWDKILKATGASDKSDFPCGDLGINSQTPTWKQQHYNLVFVKCVILRRAKAKRSLISQSWRIMHSNKMHSSIVTHPFAEEDHNHGDPYWSRHHDVAGFQPHSASGSSNHFKPAIWTQVQTSA